MLHSSLTLVIGCSAQCAGSQEHARWCAHSINYMWPVPRLHITVPGGPLQFSPRLPEYRRTVMYEQVEELIIAQPSIETIVFVSHARCAYPSTKFRIRLQQNESEQRFHEGETRQVYQEFVRRFPHLSYGGYYLDHEGKMQEFYLVGDSLTSSISRITSVFSQVKENIVVTA